VDIPGEKLIIKLWESLADKGIGGLLKPWQTRREGRAAVDVKRLEMLELAQAQRDADGIRAGTRLLLASGAIIDAPDPSHQGTTGAADTQVLQPLNDVVSKNRLADAARREINIAKAVIAAEVDLEADTNSPPEESVSEDWLFRWRDSAATVSDKDLQSLWGRVLAGEVRAPGTFSLRTLEFLRNLSQSEARSIERVAPFIVQGTIFRNPEVLSSAHGIRFDELLALQELGLLSGLDSVGLKMEWRTQIAGVTGFNRVLRGSGRLLLVKHSETEKTLDLKVFMITTMGQQVFPLANAEANEQWLHLVGQEIKAMGFDVSVGGYEEVSKGFIRPTNLTAL